MKNNAMDMKFPVDLPPLQADFSYYPNMDLSLACIGIFLTYLTPLS